MVCMCYGSRFVTFYDKKLFCQSLLNWALKRCYFLVVETRLSGRSVEVAVRQVKKIRVNV